MQQAGDLGRQDPKPSSCISPHLDSVRKAAFRSSAVLTAGDKGQKGEAKDEAPLKYSQPSKDEIRPVQGYMEHRLCCTGIILTVMALDLQLFSPVAWTPL